MWCAKKEGSGPFGVCVADREQWSQAPLGLEHSLRTRPCQVATGRRGF